MNRSSAFFTAAFAALLVCAVAPAARAQAAYPAKPITLVVAYPPGGSTDLTGRALGAELSRRLGVAVVVENVGGAGGALGAQKVANAPPDGHTLLVGANNEVLINRLVNANVKTDLKDFTAIGLIASQPLVLVASPRAGVKTTDEFIALLKKQPGRYSYGTSGVGTSLHLAGELIKQQGGVFLTHIPYRGAGPMTNDLLGGSIDFGVLVLSSALPHVQSGKLVALGTTERARSAVTPDVPALAESASLAGIDMGTWFVLMGPAHLPEAVVQRLRAALAETLRSPDFRKRMEATSSTVPAADVDVARFLETEAAKYKRIVQRANIKE